MLKSTRAVCIDDFLYENIAFYKFSYFLKNTYKSNSSHFINETLSARSAFNYLAVRMRSFSLLVFDARLFLISLIAAIFLIRHRFFVIRSFKRM